MNFKLFFKILILFSSFCFSQKQTESLFDIDSSIDNLVIDLNNVFSVKLIATDSKQIIIKTKSEGEYANHFILSKKLRKNTVFISGNIGFSFPDFKDKLSAHKVHSIEVELIIPDHLMTSISSDIGNVSAEGNYKSLSINLLSGNCYLDNIYGNIIIKTINGDINLKAKKGVIKATSSLGVITKQEIPLGISNFSLKTTKGNINIAKAD
jgi:hypothetical protein